MTAPALLTLAEGSSPATPGAGYASLYPDASGLLHVVDNVSDKPLAMYRIATATLVAASAITFTSIPQIYTSLVIAGKVQSARASTVDWLGLRFGTGGGAVDPGANYGYSYLYNNNASYTGGSSINNTSAMGSIIDAASSSAGAFSPVYVTIVNYRDANFKYVSAMSNQTIGATTAATTYAAASGGSWRNTGSITSVSLAGLNAWDNLAIGSSLTLYGLY